MKLDKIITLANSNVRLRFLAMERSLRSTGCDLPLLVIPYDEKQFDLPPNASWWIMPELTECLQTYKAHPTMKKYQCLTIGNYQFIDSDAVFLSNPADILKKAEGFVASCGHWNNPGHTYTNDSLKLLQKKSTLWQKFVFNTGQFACDRPLYSMEALKSKILSPELKSTCIDFRFHEQPGVNLLVNLSDVPVNNLTLPPYNMESTWAGDYKDADFENRWNDSNKPYLIHWAGCRMDIGRPIDQLFYQYLTKEEKEEWDEQVRQKQMKESKAKKYVSRVMQKLRKIYDIIQE